MPVLAECPNCGKSYQAPDSMAGKQVRCKQCQTVFRIEAPVASDGDELDLDALAQSFGGGGGAFDDGDETTAGGPTLDAHGRPSIGRRADVSDIPVNYDLGGTGLRANLRYRYPFARQIDVGLPWLMVVLAILVPLRLCLTTTAEFDEPLTTGVGVSRFFVMFFAFLICVVPLTHLMIVRAGREMRFNLPRTPLWRSLGCASAVLLLGGALFVLSGGTIGGAIIGLIVGVAVCVALVTLLFRLLPHEVTKTATYAAIGSGGGAILAAILIFAINYAGSKAAAAQAEPTLFVSPIAIGLPWVEKPVVVAKVPVKPPVKPIKPSPAPSATQDATSVAPARPAVVDVAMPSALLPIAIPAPPDGSPKLLKSIETTPVDVGFDEVLLPLTRSHVFGVVRSSGGTLVQCWDANTWYRPTVAGRNFDRSQGDLAVNTIGDRVVRIVSTPYNRIEQIVMGSAMPMQPVRLPDSRGSLDGFLNDHDVSVRRRAEDGGVILQRYDLATGTVASTKLTAATATNNASLKPAKGNKWLRYAPDGSGVLIAGRDEAAKERPFVLAFYAIDKYDAPTATCEIPWSADELEPWGMALSGSGRAALLLNAGGEANLTFYQMRNSSVDGTPMSASSRGIEALGLGTIEANRPNSWNWDNDPVCWIDDDTVLIYGKAVIDARTGRTLGAVTLPGVANVQPLGDGKLLVTHIENNNKALWVVTFDPALLEAARKQ